MRWEVYLRDGKAIEITKERHEILQKLLTKDKPEDIPRFVTVSKQTVNTYDISSVIERQTLGDKTYDDNYKNIVRLPEK